jgi:glycosyltransferase involved in cell wall biosynthesis
MIEDLALKEKISLPGEKINPYPWLRNADVYVLSSFYEGLPNALIEAMACGLQLISVDCPGGSREILMDGKCGQLVKMNDPGSLADAMLACLDHPIVEKIMEESLKRFHAEAVVEKYLSLITHLTE